MSGPRSKKVYVRLSNEEHEKFKAICHAEQRTYTNMLRYLLRWYMDEVYSNDRIDELVEILRQEQK